MKKFKIKIRCLQPNVSILFFYNKFDIEKANIINFTKMDGIYGYQFNINSSLKNKDGM